jgi:hypothetical protein
MTKQTQHIGQFLSCLAVAMLAWPVAAQAQSDTDLHRVVHP